VVGIRRNVDDQHLACGETSSRPFSKAKKALLSSSAIGHLFVQPALGAVSEFEHAKALMGEDYWS